MDPLAGGGHRHRPDDRYLARGRRPAANQLTAPGETALHRGDSLAPDPRYSLRPIGYVRSPITDPRDAPRQGVEGAPDAWIELDPGLVEGLHGISSGEQLILITWLHRAARDVLQVHPRDDVNLPLTGVFLTRSQDRPNPLGLHRVRVHDIDGHRLRVGPLEAIDGTPVVDIKPVLLPSSDS